MEEKMANIQKQMKWIEGISKGEEWAFLEFYHHYKTPLYRHLRLMLKKEEEAQECLQETFLTVVKKIDFFKNHISFKAWVYRIATNKAIDHIRKNKKHKAMEYLDHHASTDQHFENNELWQMLGVLENQQRVVAHLRIIEEMSLKEEADAIGSSVMAVKQTMYRARIKLKEVYSQQQEWV